ncbi:MAG TPA: hypothetical protein VHG33_05170 [Woeseiaceae bacterium]|nr:hypothetical protein [Woeseiaceae bacterium]
MIQQFLRWLGLRLFPPKSPEPPPRPVGVRVRPPAARAPRAIPPTPQPVPFTAEVSGTIVDGGPGKNVFVRNRYVREDSGTHETLKILDDSLLQAEEEAGIDPYNTGRFDRAKSWDVRFRK